MFVDSPFWFAILVSGVIAGVLMLALWLGLDRPVARRIVLSAIIPAILVAVPAAVGLPEGMRGGAGAVLAVILIGGLAGIMIDVARFSARISSVLAATVIVGGGWLVLGDEAAGTAALLSRVARPETAHSVSVLAWAVYLVVALVLAYVTLPDFAADSDDEKSPRGKGKAKGKSAKVTTSRKGKTTTNDAPVPDRGPGALSVFLALVLGMGIIAVQFGLRDLKILYGAMAVALLIALISEKAAPQYRAAVWLSMVAAIMVAGATAILRAPASLVAHAVLLLVLFAGAGATILQRAFRLDRVVTGDGTGAEAGIAWAGMALVRALALALPVFMAALVAYIGASMSQP
ncbi:hypothetical protein TH25_08385 [Thalassospira profundimaris]|uniref:Uncharacterized protein n=1 Tax=Thalassospira profundimaris TaxID=502049 RepID=A0A367XFZ7_9PROT|nr:hypothetical protein [Thalassospira profundimaris]RCK51691.1 hypothetical protein TH25_08385 [Thalassospira profundimaris]